MSLTIPLDSRTEDELSRLSLAEGIPASEMAARLLRRAIRARRARPVYDIESLPVAASEFIAEDLALANSDEAHRAALLAAEDVA